MARPTHTSRLTEGRAGRVKVCSVVRPELRIFARLESRMTTVGPNGRSEKSARSNGAGVVLSMIRDGDRSCRTRGNCCLLSPVGVTPRPRVAASLVPRARRPRPRPVRPSLRLPLPGRTGSSSGWAMVMAISERPISPCASIEASAVPDAEEKKSIVPSNRHVEAFGLRQGFLSGVECEEVCACQRWTAVAT